MNITQGRLLDWGQQVILLMTVCFLFWFFGSNAADNIASLGIKSGFDFLDERAGYDISFSLIDYSRDDSYFQAYLVGVSNTLLVSFLSIILACVLGFIIGVGRVSQNWLIARLTRAYVEFIRNVPLVVQLVWWYALFLALPPIRQSIDIGGTGQFFLSNRGLVVPSVSLNGWGGTLFAIALISIFLSYAYKNFLASRAKWKGFYNSQLSQRIAIATFMPLCIVVYLLTSGLVEVSQPALQGFNFRGGMTLIPELVALWIALSVYSSSYIAEIVRGCIQSVHSGQGEAGKALGFSQSATMWQIIVPQAIYPMVPQLASVFLNIIKNSSLGVVIGFMELVSSTGGTTLNNTGQAIECILIVMATYCVFSLTTSLLMNWYNSRVAVGR
jgi:general L-amino acid transport system permease protein